MHTSSSTAASSAPPSWGEWLVVALLLAGGLEVRFSYLGRLAIEHFDEGVYASNIWFTEADPPQYPMRHLYAPPLFPKLVEWCIIFGGPDGVAPFLPGLVSGTLALLVVWWSARCWFGPLAGLCGLMLASYSDFHATYSRTVLTDPLLGLWMSAGVFAFVKAYHQESFRWGAIAGLCSGLAWCTKYNGWITLGIGGGGLVVWWIVCGSSEVRRRWKRQLQIFAVAAGVAILCWLPVWWGLQALGGYVAVAANHRGYVVGWSGWWDSLRELGHKLGRFEPSTGSTAVMLSVGLFGLLAAAARVKEKAELTRADKAVPDPVRPGEHVISAPQQRAASSTRWRRLGIIVAWPGVLGGAVIALHSLPDFNPGGMPLLLSLFAVQGLLLWLLERCDIGERGASAPCLPMQPPSEREAAGSPSANITPLAVSLLAVWWIGLTIATPLYTPYPRLTLPWHVASWLATAALVGALANWRRSGLPDSPKANQIPLATLPVQLMTAGLLAVVLLAGLLVERHKAADGRRSLIAWQDRRSLSQAATIFAQTIDQSLEQTPVKSTAVVNVESAPALVYHLNRLTPTMSQPAIALPSAGNLRIDPDGSSSEFAIVGAGSNVPAQDPPGEAASRLKRIPFLPSDLVVFDESPEARSTWNRVLRLHRGRISAGVR